MMKKILLGSTLLMSVASFSAANAGEPLKLGISGFYQAALGFTGDSKYSEGDGRRNANLKQNTEVHFSGEFTMDIGVTAGVKFELEGQTHSDQIDATYAYLKSGLGELRIGNFGSAAGLLCGGLSTASNAFPVAGAMNFSNLGRDGNQLVNSDSTDVCNTLNDKGTKIAYFSPSFGGFRVATSYMIDDTEDQGSNFPDGSAGGLNGNNAGDSKEWSLGATYDVTIGSFGVSAYAGWEKAFDPETNTGSGKASGYQFGGAVTFGNLSFGMGYQQGFNLGDTHTLDSKTFGLTGTWKMDAFTFGFTWLRGWYDLDNVSKKDTHDVYMITTSYALGTGVTLDGAVTHDVYKAKIAGNDNYKSYTFQFGMTIGF